MLTRGLWPLVIAVRAAAQHRQVVAVAPDGSMHERAGPTSSSWLTVTAVLAIGAAGLLVSTMLGPVIAVIAVIAVPLGVALLANWPTE